jgi:hypothetical protein
MPVEWANGDAVVHIDLRSIVRAAGGLCWHSEVNQAFWFRMTNFLVVIPSPKVERSETSVSRNLCFGGNHIWMDQRFLDTEPLTTFAIRLGMTWLGLQATGLKWLVLARLISRHDLRKRDYPQRGEMAHFSAPDAYI